MTSRRLLPILAVLAVVAAAVAGPARAELLYVIQNDNIYSYDVSLGSASAIAASRQNVLVGSPYVQASYGMAFDSSGNLLVASYTDSSIYAYDSSGTQLYSFSTGVLSSDRPRFVAFDVDGSGFNQSAAPAPAVPEPGTWAAAALLAGGAAFARLRKRKVS